MAISRDRTGPRGLRAPGFEPTRFEIAPMAATLGGLVTGLDLREPMDDATAAELRAALDDWKVLRLDGQPLTAQQHADVATRFGRLVDDHLVLDAAPDPVDNLVVFARDGGTVGLENAWHTDGTFRPVPAAGTMLRAIEVPALGGDTIFADMAAAYDNLPDEVQAKLVGLTAVHDWSIGAYADKYGEQLEELRRAVPPQRHPVVIHHPRTGRPTLFVNRLFTASLEGLPPEEGDALLAELCHQADVPEYQCRIRWAPDTVVLWDNIAVQHYGVNDYHPQRRVMARATFYAEPPDRLEPADGA